MERLTKRQGYMKKKKPIKDTITDLMIEIYVNKRLSTVAK